MDRAEFSAFVASAQEGNFTAAAHRLGLTQPTVSAAVTKLERELGAQLFTRTRPLTLTDAGAALLPHATEALNALDETWRELRSVAQGTGGTLRLGSSVFAFDLDVPNVIDDFRRRHPAVRITLIEHLSIRPMSAAILAGRLDMGLTITVEAPPAGVRSDTLRSEPYVLLLSTTHPLAAQERVTVDDIRDQPFIGRPLGDQFRSLMDQVCDAIGLKPTIVLEVDGYESTLSALRRGTAVGLGVPAVATLHPDEFKALPLDAPDAPPVRLVLLTPTNRALPAAASTLRSELLAAAAHDGIKT
ncbi:LysR family transcriptional regulator [Conexibacter stalactiti]|uniref:LysR family transcriptional regulator n=1 Tax=Conexibacter stalactiti TaxID=1940611 RepID=A0ABU4HIC1_9ACTN|nr:LysR family transcriptional regulator [Conexibacter stalactiti]MDW5593051.1 LysR family transcriptional regulator [Conexibacter stalactiti]MEC5033692.1 LysR family transcriptional regulator [Conexibacter stalactiti]